MPVFAPPLLIYLTLLANFAQQPSMLAYSVTSIQLSYALPVTPHVTS